VAQTTYTNPETGQPVTVDVAVNPDSIVVEGLDSLRSETESLNNQLTSRYTDLLSKGINPSRDPTYQQLQQDFQTKSSQVQAMDNYVAALKASFSESGSSLIPRQGQSSIITSEIPAANVVDPPPTASISQSFNQTTAPISGVLPSKSIPITPATTDTGLQSSNTQQGIDPPPSVDIPGNPQNANIDSLSFANNANVTEAGESANINNALTASPGLPINSTGEIVAAESDGRVDGSFSQNPPASAEFTATP